MIVDIPQYNQIQITHSDRLAVPYEITARAIEIINNTGSIFLLVPPFNVDFYPNAYWLATPPPPFVNDTRGTSADYMTIYIGLAVIGGSLILVYVYTYQTSCDRPKNKMKPKCQGIKPREEMK
jgi:hypothetical protein